MIWTSAFRVKFPLQFFTGKRKVFGAYFSMRVCLPEFLDGASAEFSYFAYDEDLEKRQELFCGLSGWGNIKMGGWCYFADAKPLA